MRHRLRWSAVALLCAAAVAGAGCGQPGGKAAVPSYAAAAEPIAGTNLKQVTVSREAAERLGIQTAEVREQLVGNLRRTTIPYAAVLYDARGDAWAFVRTEDLVFVRAAIAVDFIEGDVAVLSDGPPPGTPVVTTGVAELYGVETGVGGGH